MKLYKATQFALFHLSLAAAALTPRLAAAQVCEGEDVNGICVPKRTPGTANYKTVGDLVNDFLEIGLFLVGLVAVVFVFIGGYQYLMAGGDAEKTGSAKQMITNALLGLIIVIFAYSIVQIVINLLPKGA